MSKVYKHVQFRDGAGRLRSGTITADNTPRVDIRIGHSGEVYTNVRKRAGRSYWEDIRFRGTVPIVLTPSATFNTP